jgi:hypothetical protein
MRLHVLVAVGLAALSVLSRGEDGAPSTRPIPATTRAATTRFAAASRPATRPVPAEVAVARRMIDAGDPRIIPTLLWWLATEQDVPAVGSGSSRLQEAIRGAAALRVKEAVPWLIGVSGFEQLRQKAAAAALHIDPSYSSEFVREQFEGGRYERIQRPAAIVAAVVLVETAKDEAARDFLLQRYRAGLDERVAGRAAVDIFGSELRLSADTSLRDGVSRMAASYPQADVREAAERVAEQMRLNALPGEELVRVCEDESKSDVQRQMASLALAWRGTPELLPRLDKLGTPSMVATTGPDAPVEEVVTPVVAGAEIRRRYRLGKSPLEAPRAPIPAVAPAEARPVVEGDAEEVLMHCIGASPNPNSSDATPEIGLAAYDGSTPLLRLKAANDAVLKASKALDYDGVVLARLSLDQKTVLSIRALDPRPGELKRDGYVLVERCKVTDGKTERAAVRLSKFGRQFIARIPNRTAANGTVVSDSTLTRAVEGLKPGEVVEARFEETGKLTMLTRIAAYRPAVAARFLRRVEVRRGEETAAGIEVWLGGRKRTFVLPPQEGPRRPAMDAETLDVLMPGCEVRLTAEGNLMADGGAAPQVLADLRIDGSVYWNARRSTYDVRARRASWASGGSMSWNWAGGESAALRTALARFNGDKTNALGFAPDVAAGLREAFGLLEKPDIEAVRKELTPLGEALRREGNREKQEPLEQRMLLGLQRFVVSFDAKAEEQGARVKKILNEEQYKALLAFGAGRG